MKNQKFILLALAALVLAGCGGNSDPSPSAGDSGSDPAPGSSASGESASSDPSSGASSSATPVSAADILKTLSGDLATKGSYDAYNLKDGEPWGITLLHYDIASFVSDDHFYNSDGDEAYDYYENAEGQLIEKGLDPTTNTVVDTVMTDYYEVPVMFDDECFNPFTLLTEEDIASSENGVITFTIDETIGAAFGLQMAYFSDFTADTLSVSYEASGKVTSIDFSEDYEATDENGEIVNIRSVGKFVPVAYEELGIKEVAPRPETEATDKLGSALKALQGDNYSMTVTIADNLGESTISADALLTKDGFLITVEGETEGLIQVDSANVALVEAKDGKLNGTRPAFAGTVAGEMDPPEFNYLDCMFDVDETDTSGNTFVLPDEGLNYGSAYLAEMLPDLLAQSSYSPDAGSLKIKVDEEKGEYTFSYSHTLVYGSYIFTDVDVTTVLSKVGTTTLGYAIPDDYVAFVQQTKWSEVNNAVAILAKYGMAEADLPFLSMEGLAWGATLGDGYYVSDRIETLALPTGKTGEDVNTEYAKLLLAANWTSSMDDYGYVYYSKKVGTATFTISPEYDETGFTIWFVDTQYETALGKWIEDNFTTTNNYTMTATIYETAYAVNQSTYERTSETPTRENVVSGTVAARMTGEAYYQEYTEDGSTQKMYIESAETGTNVYDYDDEAGAWGAARASEYALADAIYSMADIVDYTGGYVPDASDATKFTSEDDSLCYYWASIINVSFGSGYSQADSLEFVLDEANGTLEVTAHNIAYGYYYTDETRTVIEERSFSLSITISKVGTTTMEGLSLPTSTTPAA